MMREYFHLYQAGGIARLNGLHLYQPVSNLGAHTVSLEAHFRAEPPAAIKEAQREIEPLTSIHRSETQVRHYLKARGLRCCKMEIFQAKATPQHKPPI